jgi:hypothetical protein
MFLRFCLFSDFCLFPPTTSQPNHVLLNLPRQRSLPTRPASYNNDVLETSQDAGQTATAGRELVVLTVLTTTL